MAWNMGLLGAAAGRTGDYELLETVQLASPASSVTFSSLNSTYGSTHKHLQIRMTGRTDRASTSDFGRLEMNNDATSSYSRHAFYGNGSNVVSSEGSNTSNIQINRYTAASATSNAFGATILDILDPFSTVKNTTIRYIGGIAGNDNFIFVGSGAYFKTDAVNQLKLIPGLGNNWLSGSRFYLYGIKG